MAAEFSIEITRLTNQTIYRLPCNGNGEIRGNWQTAERPYQSRSKSEFPIEKLAREFGLKFPFSYVGIQAQSQLLECRRSQEVLTVQMRDLAQEDQLLFVGASPISSGIYTTWLELQEEKVPEMIIMMAGFVQEPIPR